ncbi:type I methionyl aminopeptidase, partial [Streptococcus danieliae]|nr:type I methionyl aminopeptidase [Streptococcus danieliae]
MIKTAAQLAVMRESGRLLAQVFTMLDGFVAVGRSTLELDAAVEAFIRNDLKARPASLGQYDYPF